MEAGLHRRRPSHSHHHRPGRRSLRCGPGTPGGRPRGLRGSHGRVRGHAGGHVRGLAAVHTLLLQADHVDRWSYHCRGERLHRAGGRLGLSKSRRGQFRLGRPLRIRHHHPPDGAPGIHLLRRPRDLPQDRPPAAATPSRSKRRRKAGSHIPRDRRSLARRPGAGDGCWERRRTCASGETPGRTSWCRGRPISHPRRAPLRPASSTATMAKSRPSAGSTRNWAWWWSRATSRSWDRSKSSIPTATAFSPTAGPPGPACCRVTPTRSCSWPAGRGTRRGRATGRSSLRRSPSPTR